MRPLLLGHNTAAIDWHGTDLGRPAVFWNESEGKVESAWEAVTGAFPVRMMRFHPGNTYTWTDLVGPVEQRKPVPHDHSKANFRAIPGFDDYLRWARSLPGTPELSMIASPLRPVEEVADLVAYCNASEGPMADLRAANGHPEPYNVRYWEMGNEMDWRGRADLDVLAQDTYQAGLGRVLVDDYIALLRPRIQAMREVDPDIRIFAHAKTAPFPRQNPDWQDWHRRIIEEIGGEIDGLVIHPYYDGYPVPYCVASVDALIEDIRASEHPDLTVWVNEHARWVQFKERPWSESWNLQGAISAADFLLKMVKRPEVEAANYWCYGHRGPWRVLDMGEVDGETVRYGTPVHAMFDLLNRAILEDAQPMTVEGGPKPTPPYTYAVQAVAFRGSDGKRSLVAVNRSETEPARLSIPLDEGENTNETLALTQLMVTGDTLEADNSPEHPDAVRCVESRIEATVRDGNVEVELPPGSIAGWLWN